MATLRELQDDITQELNTLTESNPKLAHLLTLLREEQEQLYDSRVLAPLEKTWEPEKMSEEELETLLDKILAVQLGALAELLGVPQ